jgi:hypothetical protein
VWITSIGLFGPTRSSGFTHCGTRAWRKIMYIITACYGHSAAISCDQILAVLETELFRPSFSRLAGLRPPFRCAQALRFNSLAGIHCRQMFSGIFIKRCANPHREKLQGMLSFEMSCSGGCYAQTSRISCRFPPGETQSLQYIVFRVEGVEQGS